MMKDKPGCTATKSETSLQPNPLLRDHNHGLRPAGNAKRLEYRCQVNLDRPFGEAQHSGYVTI